MRSVLERITPSLSWADVEEGVKALSQEDGGTSEAPQVEGQVPASGNLEG